MDRLGLILAEIHYFSWFCHTGMGGSFVVSAQFLTLPLLLNTLNTAIRIQVAPRIPASSPLNRPLVAMDCSQRASGLDAGGRVAELGFQVVVTTSL